jgi:hypothetical protein
MPYLASFPNTPAAPIRATLAITPSDSATINPTKSILVVSGGTVVLRCSEDTAPQTFPNLPAYTELAFEVVAILATGTSATDIRACY